MTNPSFKAYPWFKEAVIILGTCNVDNLDNAVPLTSTATATAVFSVCNQKFRVGDRSKT
jgi:hypothetical protein